MKKMIALVLACALSTALLAGCAMDEESSAASGSTGNSGKREVNVCSWGEYIDTSLIGQFEKETGIKVTRSLTATRLSITYWRPPAGADLTWSSPRII